MSDSVYIGDFEIDPETIQVSKLPVREEIVFEVKKSDRKSYNVKDEDGHETGKTASYNALQLSLPDFPGNVLFHSYFTNSRALSDRRASRSWKLFLDKVGLPYSATAADNKLAGLRFIGTLVPKGDEDYQLDKVIGPAQ